MKVNHFQHPKAPPWSAMEMIRLLSNLADQARTKSGRRIITRDRLLDLWQENRVRLLIDHEVAFSLECGECDGCASGDGIDSLHRARELGCTAIEPAAVDNALSHFTGLCPEHSQKGALP